MAKKAEKKPNKKPPPKRAPRKRQGQAAEAFGRYVEDEVLLAMAKAGTDPAFAYAFRKTGLMPPVKGSTKHWPRENLREWKAAVAEYDSIKAARARPDAPPGDQWSTEIPTLALSGFDIHDFKRVKALIAAIEPVEKQGPMTLRARWEFAAAVLATTLSSAYGAGTEAPIPDRGSAAVEMLFEMTIALVIERAQEIYAQGGA